MPGSTHDGLAVGSYSAVGLAVGSSMEKTKKVKLRRENVAGFVESRA